ncbi:MAG: group I truncated hemoglobin [Magnetovibrionaceae bacterium]
MADVKNLFFRYGARLTDGTAELFYEKVFDEPALAHFFEKVDRQAMKHHMSNFLNDLTGGPEIYRGRDLDIAHAKYAITEQDFCLIVRLLRESLIAIGVSDPDADEIIRAIHSKKTSIVSVVAK